jgi:tetratricopeptide (TPR) repeat protein
LSGFHARVNQAHVAMWDKNYDLAVNLYSAALEAQPEDLEISLFLAKTYFRKEEYDACKAILTKQMINYPNDPRLGYNLAHCLYKSAGNTLK